MPVRSAPVGVLSKLCKSPLVVEILFSLLSFEERESLRATPLNSLLLLNYQNIQTIDAGSAAHH